MAKYDLFFKETPAAEERSLYIGVDNKEDLKEVIAALEVVYGVGRITFVGEDEVSFQEDKPAIKPSKKFKVEVAVLYKDSTWQSFKMEVAASNSDEAGTEACNAVEENITDKNKIVALATINVEFKF